LKAIAKRSITAIFDERMSTLGSVDFLGRKLG